MTACKLTLDNATLSAAGDWEVSTGSTTSQIEVLNQLTVNPNGKTIKLRNMTFTEGSTLLVDGAGVVDVTALTGIDAIAKTVNGTLQMTEAQVQNVTVNVGGILKVKVDSYETRTLTGVTLASGVNVVFILPNGLEVVGNGATMPAQEYYTYTAEAGAENLWSDTTKWIYCGEPVTTYPSGEVGKTVIVEMTGARTLTVDVADVVVPVLSISGGELTITGESTLTTSLLTSTNKVIVGGKLTIDAEGTADEPTEIETVIEVANGGTLTTKGYLNCKGANLVVAGGTLNVAEEVTTFNLASTGLSGKVVVAAGATLKNGTNDGPNYNGSPELDIAGTLEVTGTARWSLPAGTMTTLREGAVLKGAGGYGYNYAYDYFDGGTITVEGNATIAGNIGAHNGSTITFDVAEDKVLTLSGKFDGGVNPQVSGTASLKASGAGKVKLTGTTNSYTGGTIIDGDATIEVATIDNFPETGSIEVNGRLRLVNGGTVNHSGSPRYMVTTTTGEGDAAVTTTSPRLTGSGVLEVASTGWYAFPNGFMTPLAFENNCAEGVVVANMAGMTIGTLSGSGKFRSDFGTNNTTGDARVLTVKQSAASTFSGTFRNVSATGTRRLVFAIEKAEGVAEGADTTLTLSGTTNLDGVSLSVAAGASVNVTGSWAQPAEVSGTIGGAGTMGTLTLKTGAVIDTTRGTLAADTLTLEGNALTIKTAEAPTSADARLNVIKVKTAPTTIETIVLVDETGAPFESEFDWLATETEGEYTILQVKSKVIVPDYEVKAAQYASLTEAVAAGVFGDIMPYNMNLVIDFGDAPAGEAATPGAFNFNMATEFNKVTVRGTNGGVLTDTTDDDAWGIAEFVIEPDVAVTMDATLLRWTARAKVGAGAEATLQVAGTDLMLGVVLSGDGKVKVATAAEGETAAVTLLSQSAHTGGTEIAKDTIVQINRPTALGTGTVTGEGALYFLTQPEGVTTAYIDFNLSKFSGVATLGIPAGEVVEGTFNNEIWTVTSKIQLDGELNLTNGYSDGRYTFTGPWVGTGLLSLSNAAPTDAVRITGDISGFTGNIAVTGKRALTFCAEGTGMNQKYSGKICVHGDYAYTAMVNGTWTAPVSVEANAKLGGNGTIDGNLELKAGATLLASPTACVKLAAGRTLTLPASFVVQLPENTALIAPVVVLDRADATLIDLSGKTATIKVGDAEVADAQLFALSTGDLVIQKPSTYVAEVAGTVAWDDLKWSIGGVPVETQPNELDAILLKAISGTAVVTRKQPLAVRAIDAEGTVAVRFDRALVTEAIYEAIPTSITLVTTTEGLGEDLAVQLDTLKYGALATVTQTATSAIAALTLPDGAILDEVKDIIAINFKGNGDHAITGDAAVGLTNYEVVPNNWAQMNGASGTDQAVTIVKLDGSVETLDGALDYSCANGWNTRDGNSHAVLRGYLDDGGNGVNVSIDVPDTWTSYKAVIFCATDTGSTTFTAKQVNGTWYTYTNGTLTTSTTRPAAGWGDSNSRAELIPGTNTMVIEGLSGDFTLFSNCPSGTTPRGCVAGIQLIREYTEYALVSGLTATVAAETADTEVAWEDLEWVDDEGNSVAAPTAANPATIVLESDVTLNLAGAVAMQVQVLGYGHRVRFTPGTIPATAPFVFSEDTIYRMTEA
ncbi:MAG: hypothetical protein J6V91_05430, partial [Kiritimatiellae bacterium]|nr:hypothetical protein [Kiritimatiellia bacterium]